MSRLAPKKPSLCSDGPLTDGEVCQKLSVFREILKSCYGPCGRLKLIHNNRGGRVQTTSSSAVLLNGVPLSHPMLKLLAASVMNHVSRFSDSGLFAAILGCTLIENTQRLNMASSSVIKIYRQLLSLSIAYLNSEDCSCRVKVDFRSSQTLLALARTVIASKPACMLTFKEREYISSMVLKAFLRTVPCTVGPNACLGKMVVVPIEGNIAQDTTVLTGLLVEMPEALPLSNTKRLSSSCINVAVFNVSMSGDLPDAADGTVEISCTVSPEAAILEQLLRVGKQMVSEHVGLLVCQKVVHPVLKQYLQEQHVIVVDRLGAALMEPLVQMTGAQAVASYQSSVPSNCYGLLKDVCVVSFGSKELLHLIPGEDSTVCSLVLCNRNETTLSELKCTNRIDDVLSDLACSYTEYQLAVDSFCRSLESLARSLEHNGGESLVDLSHGHRWFIQASSPLDSHWRDLVNRCGCGLFQKHQSLDWAILGDKYPSLTPGADRSQIEETTPHLFVLDSFPAKINALQIAVETANLILDLKYIIQDVN
ncbi:McKusick-Kaufman/Bardet-Biedl syndromes putative chaperonin isoform X2 [Polyodon spathula]|uniref:McKusick-Kaufman/Bardet-Biedl syndromes putative chaperonin isoform X2 n=1 Tax=Polyodon spathula TaxID=7913 RepID=UPI001B7E1D7C|nr:McKusick-Kaufman/Bardet-Biedl syndromes putative chaperonin isoform X2 [Polyodon spathula]